MLDIEHMRCPLSKWTFSKKPIRDWVEGQCEGKVLNLFAGKTKLAVDEVRVDIGRDMVADHYMDALEFIRWWHDQPLLCKPFDTILLDPPYAHRKSMEMYQGRKMSPFRKLKEEIPSILAPSGCVITFGYHSVSMGARRGFRLENLLVISHGGAIHDTLATKERLTIF